ncbi:hypothetical protein BEWA_021130 [Theileria equi strain WA]|uniref:C3H1-type domain-containing protein n=1 Tax=Theileria equi strain WA TaxID=1537102 RepID=L0AW58_THEEQ|nr:hypothetical protein BEWA_021130 [Theileria equi strain WA]AFZ79266.1 hypothetical protein BEWA_021130 [Theileria equi strain WA]|eukprot:XP_004828932.1 hypothetical protein BEWA_021130 [Theileria equi strain WA]
MDFVSLFESVNDDYIKARSADHERPDGPPRENSLISLALNVVKRDSEKMALLKLKGYERVDIERTRGKHSVVCRHWLKGMCMKGEFCDFLHQLVYSRMPPCRSIEKNTFCTDNLRGCCMFQHNIDPNADPEDSKVSKLFIFIHTYLQTLQTGTESEMPYISDPARFMIEFDKAMSVVFPKIPGFT